MERKKNTKNRAFIIQIQVLAPNMKKALQQKRGRVIQVWEEKEEPKTLSTHSIGFVYDEPVYYEEED